MCRFSRIAQSWCVVEMCGNHTMSFNRPHLQEFGQYLRYEQLGTFEVIEKVKRNPANKHMGTLAEVINNTSLHKYSWPPHYLFVCFISKATLKHTFPFKDGLSPTKNRILYSWASISFLTNLLKRYRLQPHKTFGFMVFSVSSSHHKQYGRSHAYCHIQHFLSKMAITY